MSFELVAFGWIFFVTDPNAVVLSVWIGVDGCLWPISSTVFHAGIACCELIYSAPISASAAEVITFFMMFAMFNTDPLFAWFAAFSDMKNVDQICSLILVRSGRMHQYVLLEPCRSRCRTE